MSKFSGKCDLFDHINMEKMYDKGTYYESDEFECFEIFKKKTNGTIYQYFKLELNEYNIDNEIASRNEPKILRKEEIPWGDDKNHRTKKYKYFYYGKEYKDLASLNKKHYYAIKEIHFDSILDLIPYYPYIISFCSSDADKEYVVISDNSFVEDSFYDDRLYGSNIIMYDYYKQELQQHYIEVVKKLLDKE